MERMPLARSGYRLPWEPLGFEMLFQRKTTAEWAKETQCRLAALRAQLRSRGWDVVPYPGPPDEGSEAS